MAPGPSERRFTPASAPGTGTKTRTSSSPRYATTSPPAAGRRPSSTDHASAADMAGREAWARLIEDARRRRVDLILVWKLDRAFRSTLHCLRTLEGWEHQGVGFACLTQPIDTTSPTGRLLLTVLAAVAEFERSLIAERVREGMAHARRSGPGSAGRRPPSAPMSPATWRPCAPSWLPGVLSKRAAARRLRVGFGTLERLMNPPSPGRPYGSGCRGAALQERLESDVDEDEVEESQRNKREPGPPVDAKRPKR